MKYKRLGLSGLKVSELCLGAMTFGEEFGIGAPEAECQRVYNGFLDAGGNFIDTANMYNHGTSERMLGQFMGSDRHRIVLASKYSLSTKPSDPNAGGSHRKNLVQSLEASLQRLQTDYIDLYWVHGWDPLTPLGELMRALDDQVRAGKILHIGFSNAPAWIVAMANTLALERQLTPFAALQLHYNLVERSIEAEYFDLAEMLDMQILGWSPLAGGLLTGKFNPDAGPDAQAGSRLKDSPRAAQTLNERNMAVSQALAAKAKETGCSTAQLALAWMMQRSPAGVIPIIGARSHAQLLDNLGATQIDLDPSAISALDQLTAPAAAYPHTLFRSDFFRQMMYGELAESLASPWIRPRS
jgi:aryl-alcohol dehydrogenase-like predicted oxidoreductase